WNDVDAFVSLARSAPPLAAAATIDAPTPSADAAKCRIGIARDAAFHFYYDDNLARLRALGAELVPFSPLADAAVPAVDVVYLGGPSLRMPGHQCRYATREGGQGHAYSVRKRRGGNVFAEGYGEGNVLGSYVHVHWASNPLVAEGLVTACVRFREARR